MSDVEAERAVVGALLLDPAAWPEVDGVVGADDFTMPEMREIFTAITFLARSGHAHDVVGVADVMSARAPGASITIAYLANVAAATPSTSRARHYATLVRDHAQARRRAITTQETALMSVKGKPINRLKFGEYVKVHDWIRENRPRLDEGRVSIKDAADQCSADLGMAVSYMSIAHVAKETGLRWAPARRSPGKNSPSIATINNRLVDLEERFSELLGSLEKYGLTDLARKPRGGDDPGTDEDAPCLS